MKTMHIKFPTQPLDKQKMQNKYVKTNTTQINTKEKNKISSTINKVEVQLAILFRRK